MIIPHLLRVNYLLELGINMEIIHHAEFFASRRQSLHKVKAMQLMNLLLCVLILAGVLGLYCGKHWVLPKIAFIVSLKILVSFL